MVLEQINRRNLEPQLLPDENTKKQMVQRYLLHELPYRFNKYASVFGFNSKRGNQYAQDIIAYWQTHGEYMSGTPMPGYCWEEDGPHEKEEQKNLLQEWDAANNFIKLNFLSPFLSVPFYRLDPLLFNHTSPQALTLLGDPKKEEDSVDGFTIKARLSKKPEDDVVIKLVWNNGIEWRFYDELLKNIGLTAGINSNSVGLVRLREHLNKRAIDRVRKRIAGKLEKHPHRETIGGLDHRVYAQVYAQATAHMLYPGSIPPVHSVFTYGGHLVGFATPFIEGKTVRYGEAVYKYPYLQEIGKGLIDRGIHLDQYGENVIVPDSPTQGKPQIIDLDLSKRTVG